MSFHHLPVQVNPPLIASFCVKCHCFIAASGNEHTLLMAEEMHRCLDNGGMTTKVRSSQSGSNSGEGYCFACRIVPRSRSLAKLSC
jgi:hypothetical protein